MKNPFSKLIAKIQNKKDGVTALEYALIAALIAVAIITGATAAGTKANGTFTNVSNQMPQ